VCIYTRRGIPEAKRIREGEERRGCEFWRGEEFGKALNER
jgi:hypothetical protein